MRTVLAISVATLIFASGSGKVMAMVVAPLPAGLTTNHVTPASWNRCWRDSRGSLALPSLFAGWLGRRALWLRLAMKRPRGGPRRAFRCWAGQKSTAA